MLSSDQVHYQGLPHCLPPVGRAWKTPLGNQMPEPPQLASYNTKGAPLRMYELLTPSTGKRGRVVWMHIRAEWICCQRQVGLRLETHQILQIKKVSVSAGGNRPNKETFHLYPRVWLMQKCNHLFISLRLCVCARVCVCVRVCLCTCPCGQCVIQNEAAANHQRLRTHSI